MRLVSPMLQNVVYPTLSKVGYFHSRSTPVSILTYHGVYPREHRSSDSFLDNTLVSVQAFRSQLRLLKTSYNLITPDDFRRYLQSDEELPDRAVLLTCDDGLVNNLTVMAPILRDEGLSCLFFVTGSSSAESTDMLWYVELYLTLMQAQSGRELEYRGFQIPAVPEGLSDRRACWHSLMRGLSQFDNEARREVLDILSDEWRLPPDWKAQFLADPVQRQRFQILNASELKELNQMGMSIGAHTMSHPILSAQSPALASAEIVNCRWLLESCLGDTVWSIAYPYGEPSAVGQREFQMAETAGYECGFLNTPGEMQAERKFVLPRVHITSDMSLSVYEAHASGFHQWLRSRLSSAA